jgi:AcrR family transcriptional regulator
VSQTSGDRRLRQEAQRAGILEAAAEAIAENGFHGMTMRGLARTTGRGLASFYNYFPSKEEVLFSLQTGAFETLNASLKAALDEIDDPVERLYVFVLNHVRYLAEHRSVMRVLVHEASALPAARRRKVRLLKERYFQTVRDIVASILAAGCRAPGAAGSAKLDAAEIERITYSVFGMLNWSYGWYDAEHHGTPEDVAKTIHAVAVCGLVANCPHRSAALSKRRPRAGQKP